MDILAYTNKNPLNPIFKDLAHNRFKAQCTFFGAFFHYLRNSHFYEIDKKK